ncbi:hypothetical protein D3Z47_22885, partial [Lachnospiraceae bacterium]|nr:hypothetical protein [Lachnospiraceae bacterium]
IYTYIFVYANLFGKRFVNSSKKSKSYGNGVLNVLGKGQNKASGIANRQTEYAGCPQGSS